MNPQPSTSHPTSVTFVSLIHTGGPSGTVYGIYQGPLSYRKGIPHSINLNRSRRIASVTIPRSTPRVDYLALAKVHETPDCPAFNWGRN